MTPGSDDLRDSLRDALGTDDMLGEGDRADARLFPAELSEEYEVVRELGRGGMAVVYLARDRELRREVAIKVVQAQYVANTEVLQRFAREARMVAALDHPNIVTLYSVRKLTDNSLALIMQYVPGETLQQLLEREGAFSFGRARQVLTDIAEALGYAHARGIVHRDVKPENVFIDARTGQAMLSDFGIARSGELDPRVTRTNVAIGTPAYMSPEQIDGGVVDGRSDLYSLGLVGWEMLSGQQPWQGESLYGVIYRQKHDELPPLDEIRRETPADLIAAVEGALEKNARVRWSGAEDFLDVLTGRLPPPPRRPRRADRPAATTRDFMLPPEAANLPTVEWRRGDGQAAADPGALAVPPVEEPPAGSPHGARPAPPPGGMPSGPPRLVLPPERPRRRMRLLAALAAAALSIGFATNEWQRREPGVPPLVAVADSPASLPVRVQPDSAAGAIVGGSPAVPDPVPDSAPADSVPVDSVPVDSAPAAPRGGTAADSAATPATPPSGPAVAASSPPAAPAESAPSGRPPVAAPPASTGAVATAPVDSGAAAPRATAAGTGAAAPSGESAAAGGDDAGTPDEAVRISTSPALATLAPGGSHTCRLATDGTALCWGANNRGQLGDGTSERRTAPTETDTDQRFVSISAGLTHSCAVSSSAGVYCWGSNDLGQLGDGTLAPRNTPVRVRNVARARTVESANSHSCALTTAGEIYCWGSNADGELGVADGQVARSTPVRVPTGSRFSLLALGWNHSCALTTAGQAVCWGSGVRGQLGDGTTPGRRGPAPVASSQTFVSLAAGSAHSCAVTSDGRAYCWGSNAFGQLGDGTTTERAVPTGVSGGTRFARVTAGSVHTCALTTDGSAYCWGRNAYGQLGDGSRVDRSTPVRVQWREPFVALRASGSHTCATTASRRNVCWGYNLNGQLGDGTRTHRARPVAVTAGG